MRSSRAGLTRGSAGEMAIACGRVGHHEPLAALGAALRAEVPAPDAAGPYVIAAARTVVQLLHAGRHELAALLLERVEEVAATLGSGEPAAAMDALLEERGVAVVTQTGWQAIDAAERAAGEPQGRPRVKLAEWDALLDRGLAPPGA